MRFLCLIALLAAAAGCTVPFTPGDAKPAVYTPYPSHPASGSGGEATRAGPGT